MIVIKRTELQMLRFILKQESQSFFPQIMYFELQICFPKKCEKLIYIYIHFSIFILAATMQCKFKNAMNEYLNIANIKMKGQMLK